MQPMTDPDLRVLIERVMERLAAHGDKITALASEVTNCAARVTQVAERMEARYVPREVYEQQVKRLDAVLLDTQGDVARALALIAEGQAEYRKDREKDRLEREKRDRELEAERAADARSRKGLQVAVIGIGVTLLGILASVVIGVLAL